ncbi:HpcH/HpaI aldolase/citrate lyase family protein [Chloroflexota bacterium]
MEGNNFRQLIKSGRFAVGIQITIEDPAMIELAAYSGFSFLVTHAVERIRDMVRAAEAAQIPLLFSMPGVDLDQNLISRVLDTGVDGIRFPLVSSRQRAEDIVRAFRIPPAGDRQVWNGSRLGKYWGISMEEMTRRANEAVTFIMIESKEGLEHAEEILSVPGIDAVGVGVSDLSKSLGVRRDGPEILDAIQHVIKLAKSIGVTFMKMAMTEEELGEWAKRDESLRLFYLATDGVQIGRFFRGLIRNCNEIWIQSAKGHTEREISGTPGIDMPWLTTNKTKEG